MNAILRAALNLSRHLALGLPFLLAAQHANAVVTWTEVGTATNATNPSIWESESFDVTSLVAGAASATLSFDLRNDWDSPGVTTSKVEFGVDGADYFARFTYLTGDDTSHWRNVSLDVDGLIYVDQYGAFNDHLGDPLLGTAQQGGLGSPGVYVLQVQVPEPMTLGLIGIGLLGVLRRTRRCN